MKLIDNHVFTELLEHQSEPSVSIYLPMARAGDETRKNPIFLKNALGSIEQQMKEKGYGEDTIQLIVDQVFSMVKWDNFFQNQLDGLAIFAAPDFIKMFKLPYRFEEWVQSGQTFELRPLLQAYQNGLEYGIIALSRERSRLFQASKYSIVEIELGSDVPVSFEDAMKYDRPEEQLHQQTITSADGGKTPVFHGHVESDKENKNLRRFFRKLDAGIMNADINFDQPFVLVGLDYLHSIYRDASNIPDILERGLDSNPDAMDIQSLHDQTWDIVQESVKSSLNQAVARYQAVQGSKLGTSEINEIPLAAFHGKVDTLLVEKRTQLRRSMDSAKNKLGLEEDREVDLIKFSVNQTLLNGGTVHVFEEEEMPIGETPIAGVLRY